MANYEIIASPAGGDILKKIDEDGTIWFIPVNAANSDYYAYLNKDNPDWGKPLL
jgi:hypothetical protein